MKKGDIEKTLERKRIKLVKDGFRFKTQYSLIPVSFGDKEVFYL